MPVYTAAGIVLRRVSLGETDRILTLLTREYGKLGAVAKGSRRAGSRLSGATELFTHSRLLLAVGRSLDIVSQCDIREAFPRLRDDLDLLARATYFCELVDRFVEEREPNAEVFDLLLSALYLLQRSPASPDAIVHAFELHLLAERGYAPELARCVRCHAAAEPGRLGFSPSLGGVLCPRCRNAARDSIRLEPPAFHLLRALIEAEPAALVTIAPEREPALTVAQCLRCYIRARAERDLRSAEFLDMLRQTAAAGAG
ncbi:MAG: DNA repair protein RecO [Chthonomonadales bacterium]|nr:DNA repair protein RecO [Chthonomonadales bacterium]